jgi:hypothetical protein
MKIIFRQMAALLGSLLSLYMVFLGVTLWLVPEPTRSGALDTSLARDTIFMTEPKYIYLDRTPLRGTSDKIILLGASNVAAGFKLAELRPLIAASSALHSFAISGANMTEVRQVIDLVQEVQSEQARRHETLVLGIWYGVFGADSLRWYIAGRVPGDTDIDIERYRYGFEWRTASGPIQLVPWQYLDVAVTAVYPFLFLDKLARDTMAWLSSAYSARPKDLDTVVLSDDDEKSMLRYWSGMMDAPGPNVLDEQFAVLERSCEAVLSEGSSLVLVDLPIPRWHRERSPYEGYYQIRKAELVRRWIGHPGFAFLDMSDMDSDDDFYDEVHPRPHVTIQWAKRLGAALTPLLAPSAVAGPVSGALSGTRIQ